MVEEALHKEKMFRLADPLLPAIADEFGTIVGNVAMTVTAFTLGYGMLQPVCGPLGDRIGKLHVMAASLLITALIAASLYALIATRKLAH